MGGLLDPEAPGQNALALGIILRQFQDVTDGPMLIRRDRHRVGPFCPLLNQCEICSESL